LEPPTSVQAVSNVNGVAFPSLTQAEALCANCSTPVVQDADGNMDQHINGTRITLAGGRAHAAATKLTATGDASNGVQSVGALDPLSSISATRLLNGLISIATISTEVKAVGDGTPQGTRVTATNDLQGVCVNLDCGYSITTAGICKSGSSLCGSDPVNQALRQ